ncbi:hypothetical protein V5O48_018431 [Marasmius crinis-equi]|uniref:Uncharacterized protein n=1 Tax=Marasmius crinis-equi TaxID=585013 RepID=A0ABR3EL64_9AGAR
MDHTDILLKEISQPFEPSINQDDTGEELKERLVDEPSANQDDTGEDVEERLIDDPAVNQDDAGEEPKERQLIDITDDMVMETEAKNVAQDAVDHAKEEHRKLVTRCRRLRRGALQARWRISRRRLQSQLGDAEIQRERWFGYLRSFRAQVVEARHKIVELKREYSNLRDKIAFINFTKV